MGHDAVALRDEAEKAESLIGERDGPLPGDGAIPTGVARHLHVSHAHDRSAGHESVEPVEVAVVPGGTG